jgi:LuxR family transcriptional regulator, maltose regulon positive regulatory protein
MVRQSLPRVLDDQLMLPDRADQSFLAIQVGSEAWYAWLDEPATRSFAFHSPQGTLTARREHRYATLYWYAYRSREGHLHKIYLGKSKELTLVRLHEAATVLSAEGATSPRPHGALPPLQPAAVTPLSSATGLPSLHLLTTKITVPPARPNMMLRPRLTQRMHAAMRSPLTLIVAPAGWGKTTLLTAWHVEVSHSTWPLAWVSLDASDNDPLRFWTYVISTLNSLHPGVGEIPLALLYASVPPPIEDVLAPLLNALNQLPTDTVLVLDDFHHIEAEVIHDALTYLVEHLPPKLHLVIASRSDPLLPLARLRAQGALTELRAPDLCFTVEETTAFLTEMRGLLLSTEQVAALQARTEGWIAGLHLAALSLQDREDVAGFIAAFSGSHRYVVDYLLEEVLSRQPATVQDFLLQTCILDRLSGPLCDAVCRREDSQARLVHVERNNLFLVSLDEEQQWYRYHHLFAEALHSRLQQTQPALAAELHRRASRWYEQHQLFDEAVAHALAIPEVEHAARLIEEYAQLTNFPSQFQVLLGWLDRLPDVFVRSQPSLCIMHAITLVITHQLEKAAARVQDAERCLHEEMPAQQRHMLLSLIAAFRGYQARFLGDYERGVPLGHQALELMPEMEMMSPLKLIFRLGTFMTAASTYLVDGDMTAVTERQVEAAVMSARTLGNLPAIMKSISNLARFQLLQGRLRQAAVTIEQATQLVPQPGGLQTLLHGADYYLLLGELLREWNQLHRAEQHLAQGLDLVRGALTTDADTIMRGYLAFACLQQACGQGNRARETLEAFTQLAQQRGFAPTLLAHGAAVQARVALAQGNLAAAIRWAEASGLSSRDELSYPREQEYLTLARVHIAQGREHPTGPFLSKALALLERLYRDAEAKMRMRSVLEVLLLRTLALQAQGDPEEALTALGRALVLAEPEGYIRLFLDEGTPMVALLRQAQRHKLAPAGYVATLLEASGEPMEMTLHPSSLRSSPLLESLTVREREVLRLLINGASNREIADQLVVSVNTVKKHVFNICSKLNVQGRTKAIAKVRTLNIMIY